MKQKLDSSKFTMNVNIFFGNGIKKSLQHSSSDFFNAIRDKDWDLIDYFLTTDLINKEVSLGNTPLHYAVNRLGDLDSVRKFLVAGANPNVENDDGVTPLEMAVDNCHTDQIAAASFVRRDSMKSDFYIAQSLETVELLLQYKADPNLSDSWNSVRRAFWRQNLAAAKLLIVHLRKEDKNGDPWYVDFIKAVLDGAFNIKLLDLLIENGADLSYKPESHRSYFEQIIHLFTIRKIFYQQDAKNLVDYFKEILQAYNYLLVHLVKPVDEKPLNFLEQEYEELKNKLDKTSISDYEQILGTLKTYLNEISETESRQLSM